MIKTSISRLEYLCETIPQFLSSVHEKEFSQKPSLVKWSKKEILGHLIDSASNNHQRFVRVQFEDMPAISYDQNKWNTYNYYDKADGNLLIVLWAGYNKHQAHLVKHIPDESLLRKCRIGENTVTLEFLIHDYVVHMEHHLKQIVNYR